jgi:hypothetical protein
MQSGKNDMFLTEIIMSCLQTKHFLFKTTVQARKRFCHLSVLVNLHTRRTVKTHHVHHQPPLTNTASTPQRHKEMSDLFPLNASEIIHWRQLTSDELTGWYAHSEVTDSLRELTFSNDSLCTYSRNDPNDQTRLDSKGKRHYDYYGCNYCHKSSIYISHNNECFHDTPYKTTYNDMCPKHFHRRVDAGPFGYNAIPSISFNRSTFNWYSATPVDHTKKILLILKTAIFH